MISQIQLEGFRDQQKKIEELKQKLYGKKEQFEKDNAELIESIRLISEQSETLKYNLKLDAEQEFKETGNKKLLGGIGIRESIKLFYEEDAAINWARPNMPVAIKEVLDKKQFEAYAKTNELEFVEKDKVLTVTFPKEIKI